MTNNLHEYSDNSQYEFYTGIVLDKEKNEFKVIKGKFRDKKDFYEKASKRGLILRKCFESTVWNWIEQNAPDDLTAYLMYSTAFSKWRGNNILSDYYVKLLNDIPQLNRETRKGDPNSKGKPSNGWYESTMTNKYIINEAFDYETLKKRYLARKEDTTSPHKVSIYPINYNGEIDKTSNRHPLVLDILTYDSNEGINKFYDPKFLREFWYNVQRNVFNGDYPAFALFVDDDRSNYTIISYEQLLSLYQYVVKKKEHTDAPTTRTALKRLNDNITQIKTDIKNVMLAQQEAKEQGDYNEAAKLGKVLEALKAEKQVTSNKVATIRNSEEHKYTQEEKERARELKQNLYDLNHHVKQSAFTKEDREELKRELEAELKAIDDKAFERRIRKDYNLNTKHGMTKEIDRLKDKLAINSNPVPSNPIHGGSPEDTFLSALNRKRRDEEKLKKIYNKMSLKEPVTLKNPQKQVVINKDKYNTLQNAKKSNLEQHNNMVFKSPTQPENHSDVVSTFNQLLVNLDNGFTKEDVEKMSKDIIQEYLKSNTEYNSPVDVRRYFNSNPTVYYNLLNKKAQSFQKKESAYVNQGVDSMLIDQNKEDFSNSKGILPMAGKIVENEIEEAYTHSELNPNLFEGDKLKRDVKNALLEVANTFEESLDLPIAPVDIYFTGSSANYNYNDQSDIDLHLVYDFEKVGIHAEIVSKYLQAAKKVFNSKYNVKIKGIPVEVGAENLHEPLVTTAIYSVLKDQWVKKPTNAEIEIANPDMPAFNKITSEIEDAIQSQDSSVMGEVWKFLGKLRKDSLAKEGEFGPGNALFKKLRNMGFLTRLKDAYYSNKSKELSLESLEEII